MSTLALTSPETVVGPDPLAPRVIGVVADADAGVVVTFETGEERRVDLRPLLDRGVFRALREPAARADVSVVAGGGGIEWACGADLSANRLYFGAR